MNETVLEFERVTVEGGHLHHTAIWQASFRLKRSDLMLVRLESGRLALPLADAAQGLIAPIAGRVAFLGKDWSALSFDETCDARSRIGRVFDEPGWISELNMDDNITLSQRHHTHRPADEIRDEAAELARRFSLPGLPIGRASAMRDADLRRAACVRAFLGRPELLILDRPTAGVYPAIMSALMASVRLAQRRGAAILWTTEDWNVWTDAGIKPTIRAVMTGAQLSLLGRN